MTPIFDEYLSMLKSFGVDLSKYNLNTLWIDRSIIKGINKGGRLKKSAA